MEGKEVNLTVTEYKLLEILAKNKGKVITKDRLLDKVWDSNGNFVDENTLSVNIRRLRKKIEKDSKKPEYIITVFGIGYTFGE
ncbi:helix-turn-helix domain-containing protein [Clostridium estertheticum]|uniref:winged helix-turn-helix domain-containing protein n=1 Tax=Clostridium estertheticum TaxID=238834 RepID=UPI001CF453AE|nr:helix-turn-helix domain-containing protein [Clostridium estertheticum]MCB2354187.1 helix-turn-helix domain-containing protein [Clostridium estertheticum]WAG43468.1 helix-turn-helix domain-containing protein [Clostridium estertheticum]